MNEFKKAKAFFETRTRLHKDLVEKNILKLLKNKDFNENETMVLSARGKTHDDSKYSDREKTGFIWLTWHYKNGRDYNHSEHGNIIRNAVFWHYKSNSHHPEYYKKVCNVLKVDIAEMICDHAAMSQELKNSLYDFTKEQTLQNYGWNEYQRFLIWDFVNVFDDLK